MNVKINFCVLNAKIMKNDDDLLNRIKFDMHTHILTNFEFAFINALIRNVFQTFIFRDRFVLIAVDEVHLMKNWINWRSNYDRFDKLRNMLFRFVFFFATSAILKNELFKKLVVNVGSCPLNHIDIGSPGGSPGKESTNIINS